jgi:hypothetical protein
VAAVTSTAQKTCRLLYYGPEDSGKRANLRHIHLSIPPEQRESLASGDPERMISFRVKHGEQGDWQVLVQAVDAGRERYRSAGMPDRAPFDGIVFVVDSSVAQLDHSLASFEALKTYLGTYDLDLMDMPLVIQYNGRDGSDVLPVDRMESLLNPWGLLSFPANAAKGEGVRETLKAVLGLSVNHIKQRPEDPAPIEEAVTVAETNNTGQTPAPAESEEVLGIDYGPPLPGSEIGESTKALSNAIFEELRPPVVIPVKIPRRLLAGEGPVRILLEVEIDDSGTY